MPELARGEISPLQLTLVMIGFSLGSSLLISPGGDIHPDTWLVILLGCVQGLAIALIFLTLARRFPGMSFIEISDTVWGRYFGKIISAAFLWYIFHLGMLNGTTTLDFVQLAILPKTPSLLLVLIDMGICATAVWGGMEVIARCSEILVPLLILFSLILAVLLIPKFEPSNLQPVMQTPLPELLKASAKTATLPFGESAVFLMILPFLNDFRKSLSSLCAAFAVTSFILILGAFRTILVMGDTSSFFVFPLYQVTRLIEIGNVLTRVEILAAINYLIMGFLKLAVLFLAFVLGLSKLLKLKSDRTLIIPTGLLMGILSLYNVPGVVEILAFAHKIYPIYALPFEVGIPLATLAMAWIRKLPREGQQS